MRAMVESGVSTRNAAALSMALALMLALAPSSPQAQTFVSGAVEGEWTLENSPYYVDGPVWIESGAVLAIEGGVVVRFIEDDSLTVYGTLLVQDDIHPRVLFESADIGTGLSWYGIFFVGEGSSGSILRYSVIEDAQYGVNCAGSSPTIEFCAINAIYTGLTTRSSAPIFSYNSIVINNHSLGPNLVVKGINSFDSHLVVSNCEFQIYNASTGHDVSAYGVYSVKDHLILDRNLIYVDAKGKSVGVYICFAQYDSIHHNEIVITSQNSFVQAGIILLYSIDKGAIINNTIHVGSPNKDIGLDIYESSSKDILNNIFIGDHSSLGIRCSIYFYNLVQYNDFFGHSTISVGCRLDSTNIFVDPEFLGMMPDSLYFLSPNSPCIDRGSPEYIFLDPDSTRNDMGAHYYHQYVEIKPSPEKALLPAGLNLKCYPNPTNSSTEISFIIKRSGWVTIQAFDVTGRIVSKILDRYLEPGAHSLKWDLAGKTSGIYFICVKSEAESQIKRLTLMK